MDEFELIRQFFDRPHEAAEVTVGIGDDGAVLSVDGGLTQVIDTLVEGVHFPSRTAAADIAYRALAVNLSDLAAMGSQPHSMLLALTTPQVEDAWFRDFANGLFAAANEYGVVLIGGDTTRGRHVVVTVCVNGDTGSLLRSGARVGDTIFVTGTLGDAAAGLRLLQNGEQDAYLTGRFNRPAARVAEGRALCGDASAAIDLSDGFAGDLRKLLSASGVGARVAAETLPLSEALVQRFGRDKAIEFALSGGDDYELCFTAAQPVAGVRATAVGVVTKGSKLRCTLDGAEVAVDDNGYRHFR